MSRIAMQSLAAALLAVLLAGQASANPNAPAGPVDPTDPTSVATASLATLSMLTTKATYAAMGFQSFDEIGRARLGSPIPVFMIRLDELKSLDLSADPKRAMHDMKEQIFPVHVGGATRTAIVVKQNKSGHWELTTLGSPGTVKLLDSVRATHARTAGKTYKYFLVRIPALYQMFLGHMDARGQIHLITVQEHKELGIRRGDARPARTVLELVQKLARNAKTLQKP